MPLSTGQILSDRYRVVSLLGQGGFGAVYRAWDMNLKAPVALKENLTQSPETVRQFTVEARLLAGLRHENLPYVIDHFVLSGQGQYLVMEFVEGEDLGSMLEQAGGPLTEAQVIPWIQQIAHALAYLHSQNPAIIHRDVKPANIKITPKGKVMLVDFGIAKRYDPARQTTVGARAVTQGYSPPEQYGSGITDARSDVYALGATMYALLTGQVPVESLKRQLGQTMPRPRQLNPAISPAIEAVILRAMEIELEQRFQSMNELLSALATPVPSMQAVQRQAQAATPLQNVHDPSWQDAQFSAQGSYDRTHVVAERDHSDVFGPPPPQSPPPYAPSPRRTSAIRPLAVGALLAFCMVIGLLAGGGVYLLYFYPVDERTPTATWTQTSQSVAETQTAIALTAASSPTQTEPATPTRPPTEPWTSVPPPTWTNTPLPPPPPIPTFTPTMPPSPTPTENPLATWQPCPGTYPSRLHVGDRAYVSYDPPLPNRVRTKPNTSSDILGYLEVGEQMLIIDGPSCSGGWIWWKVSSLAKDMIGWTAEGDGVDYWLVPLP